MSPVEAPGQSRGARTASDADFADLVLGSVGPVLVAFHAGRTPGADLDAVAAEVSWLFCVHLDVDGSPLTAATYRVNRLPTLMVFERGEPVLTMLGPQPLDVLLRMVRALRPPTGPA